jgi:hypothetical protein
MEAQAKALADLTAAIFALKADDTKKGANSLGL